MGKKKALNNTDEYLTNEDLDKLRTSLEKDLGVTLAWGDDPDLTIRSLPLGYPNMDDALNGGFPFGGISLLTGIQSSGKTTVALLAIKNAQQLGLTTALIDVEKSFDPMWAKALGVNVPQLLVSQPRTGEQAFDVAKALVTNNIGVVILDSLEACMPADMLEADMEDAFMAFQARLVNRGVKTLNAENKKTAIILINQFRDTMDKYNPEILPGGKAQLYYATIIVRCKHNSSDWITADGNQKSVDNPPIGYKLNIVIEKDKHGVPFKTTSIPVLFTGEIDEIYSLVSFALGLNVIEQAGAWFMFNGEKYHGRLGLVDALKSNPELVEILRQKIDEVEDVSGF